MHHIYFIPIAIKITDCEPLPYLTFFLTFPRIEKHSHSLSQYFWQYKYKINQRELCIFNAYTNMNCPRRQH